MKENADKSQSLSFDSVADLYDEVRPSYPQQLIADIIGFSKIPDGGNILEVGSGSGQATAIFAEKGYSIHCVEPGKHLVAISQNKFIKNPNVTFEMNFFENTQPAKNKYSLVISATAFHWVPAKQGYSLIAKALMQDGTVALFWNMYPELSPSVHEALRDTYKEFSPEIYVALYRTDKRSAKEESKGCAQEMDKSGLFTLPDVNYYDWSQEYTSEQYIKLLNTYAHYQDIDKKTRNALFTKIRAVIDSQFDGKIINYYLAVLYTAKKL